MSPRFADLKTLTLELPNAATCARLFETLNFQRLRELEMRGRRDLGWPRDVGALGAALASCPLPGLTKLTISGCAVGAVGLDALAGSSSMRSLAKLSLFNTQVGGGLASLVESPFRESLTTLSIVDDQLTPADCAALGDLPRLEHLDLHRCKLDDACATTVAATSMPALRQLFLMENRITDRGALAFFDAEANFPRLEKLSLLGCPIAVATGQQLEASLWLQRPEIGAGLSYERSKPG
ncbi:MAG: hypothetical protein U0271_07425 [Polyangiaceae bacterium]